MIIQPLLKIQFSLRQGSKSTGLMKLQWQQKLFTCQDQKFSVVTSEKTIHH